LIEEGAAAVAGSSDTAKARAEAMFRIVGDEPRSTAMGEYLARQQAELDKISRLRALRLASENSKK
jgi:hypothetical protein